MRNLRNKISLSITVLILLSCFLGLKGNHNPENYFGLLFMFFLFVKRSISVINFENPLIHLLKIALFFYVGIDFTLNIIFYYFFDYNVVLYKSNNPLIALFFALSALEISNLFLEYQKNINHKITIQKKSLSLYLFLLLGLLNIYLVSIGYVGYGFDIKNSFGVNSLIRTFSSLFTPIVTIVSFIILFDQKNKITKNQKFIFNISIIIHITFGFLSGMKETLLSFAFFYLIFYLKSGNVLNPKKLSIIFISLFILYPLNNSFRFLLNDSGLNMTRFEKFVVATSYLNQSSIYESTNNYLNRLSLNENLFFAIDNEHLWKEYKHLDRYKYFIFHPFIPRFLWPGKPRLDIGQKLYSLKTGRETNSISPTTVGWSFLEGGYFYVFLIFFFLGITLKLINLFKFKLSIFFLNYIILLKLIKPEWDFYFFLTEIIQTLLLIILLCVFLKISIINESRSSI